MEGVVEAAAAAEAAAGPAAAADVLDAVRVAAAGAAVGVWLWSRACLVWVGVAVGVAVVVELVLVLLVVFADVVGFSGGGIRSSFSASIAISSAARDAAWWSVTSALSSLRFSSTFRLRAPTSELSPPEEAAARADTPPAVVGMSGVNAYVRRCGKAGSTEGM